MNPDIDPYAAPNTADIESAAARQFFWRSTVAGLLAATTLFTGLLLLWLGSSGDIDLGRFGIVALCSLLLAALALLVAVHFFSLGKRKHAVVFLLIALIFLAVIVFIAFLESGIITWGLAPRAKL